LYSLLIQTGYLRLLGELALCYDCDPLTSLAVSLRYPRLEREYFGLPRMKNLFH
jgi:hypothetical protein